MNLKKLNSKGFVLAETLVVTVFLMLIFTMIYSYFYPLIGEYEKRENYDDVDSVYSIYWLKRMIEDPSYSITTNQDKKYNFQNNAFFRVECSDIQNDEEKRQTCINLVNALQVDNCNGSGDNCNIFVTKYRIGGNGVSFKNTVRANMYAQNENCQYSINKYCGLDFLAKCMSSTESTEENPYAYCSKQSTKPVFKSGFVDYVISLPDYASQSVNGAKYRVIASFKHTKDNNNYYTYATIEVNK